MFAKASDARNLLATLRLHHVLKFAKVQKLQKQIVNAKEERSNSKETGRQPTIVHAFQKAEDSI